MSRISQVASRSAAALVAVCALVLLVGCGSSGGTTAGTSGPITAATPAGSRQAAPGFSGTTMDGAPVSLEAYKGRPTVLIFWASW